MERYKDCNSKNKHPQNVQVIGQLISSFLVKSSLGMTQYKAEFPFPSLFPPNNNKNVLAEWLATQGMSQFHCAETEKYAHVTFFFNGGVEKQFENEERALVPSPKVVFFSFLEIYRNSGGNI